MKLRVIGVCTTSDIVDVASVEEGKKVILSLFKRDNPEHPAVPPIEYAIAYYCIEELKDGVWDCACRKLP